MKFNENLIRLRKMKGLSQEELGYQLNVTRQTVSKWELGETTPEMNKLIELSSLFNISVDELIGNENKVEGKRHIYGYEYKSKKTIGGIPLVHINVGLGKRKAKGIIAIGNIAKGVLAIGGLSVGIISFAGIGLGLFSICGIALALLMSVGGISIGTFAIGGVAIGIFALGGLAIGVYSVGGCAVASNIALGDHAYGHIAIGNHVKGSVEFITTKCSSTFTGSDIKTSILKEFPNTWNVIVSLFSNIR